MLIYKKKVKKFFSGGATNPFTSGGQDPYGGNMFPGSSASPFVNTQQPKVGQPAPGENYMTPGRQALGANMRNNVVPSPATTVQGQSNPIGTEGDPMAIDTPANKPIQPEVTGAEASVKPVVDPKAPDPSKAAKDLAITSGTGAIKATAPKQIKNKDIAKDIAKQQAMIAATGAATGLTLMATGALAGSAFPVVGTVIGAVIGLAAGLFMGGKKKKQAKKAKKKYDTYQSKKRNALHSKLVARNNANNKTSVGAAAQDTASSIYSTGVAPAGYKNQ